MVAQRAVPHKVAAKPFRPTCPFLAIVQVKATHESSFADSCDLPLRRRPQDGDIDGPNA